MLCLISYLWLFLNIMAFAMYGIDKRKAMRNRWRISEKALIFIALIGGSVGSLMAMSLFHHKTQKPVFLYGVPAIMILHFIVAIYFMYRYVCDVTNP